MQAKLEMENAVLPKGQKMSVPKVLLMEYDLKAWMNPMYQGNEPEKICRPALKSTYRGLLLASVKYDNAVSQQVGEEQ